MKKADQASKSALNLLNSTSAYPLPYSDDTSSVKKKQLFVIFGIILLVINSITSILVYLQLTELARMKIPHCVPCNSLLTVLIHCVYFDIILQNFYTAFNLKDPYNIHPK